MVYTNIYIEWAKTRPFGTNLDLKNGLNLDLQANHGKNACNVLSPFDYRGFLAQARPSWNVSSNL